MAVGDLSMYAEAWLLDTAGAIGSLPVLRNDILGPRELAPNEGETGQMQLLADPTAQEVGCDDRKEKARKHLVLRAF